MTIKELEEKFIKYGQVFTQIRKTDYGFIYARTDSEGIICYEVFKRTVKNAVSREFEGRETIPTHDKYVVYPGDKSFGYWAWCCKTLERAEIRLDGFEKENPREDPGATLTIETNNS